MDVPPWHTYALLTTGGLEQILADELSSSTDGVPHLALPPRSRVWVPAPVSLPAGYGAGKAGSASPVIVETPVPLSEAVLSHPCVSAPLALVVRTELSAAQLSSAEQAAGVLLAARDGWDRAVATWAATNGPRGVGNGRSFRVGTLRGGGKHAFSSRELDAALGAVIADSLQPEWSVHLGEPDALVICLLLHTTVTVGILLPPFRPKSSSVLPAEPASLELRLNEASDHRSSRRAANSGVDGGEIRPHMRPSRAAGLVRLAKLQPGDTVLDPCGKQSPDIVYASCSCVNETQANASA
jgi:hypothetical protein